MLSKQAYLESDLNFELYSNWRLKIEDFFDSERYFLNKEIIRPNSTILDIGCGGGGLGNAIKTSIEPTIEYTGVDPNKDCMEYMKKYYPEFNGINGFFPQDVPFHKYDLVLMYALFPQIPQWKEMLLNFARYSKKYINITLLVKLSGTTVIDKDVSYVYYLDSGTRVHQVIQNIHELINFCSVHEMRAKKIKFYGYHVEKGGNNNRCIPNKEQIRGNLLLELFEEKEEYPGRSGGAVNDTLEQHAISIFNPEIEVIIDNQEYSIY